MHENSKGAVCACGCGRTLKQRAVDLNYKFYFECYYNNVHGTDAYRRRRELRNVKRVRKKLGRTK